MGVGISGEEGEGVFTNSVVVGGGGGVGCSTTDFVSLFSVAGGDGVSDGSKYSSA